MHAGFINGWFEQSLQIKCRTNETACVARGDAQCEFIVSLANQSSKGHSSPAPLKKRTDSMGKEKEPKAERTSSSQHTMRKSDSATSPNVTSKDLTSKEGEKKKDSPAQPRKLSKSEPKTDLKGSKKEVAPTQWKF